MNTTAVEASVNSAVQAFREQELELDELRKENLRLNCHGERMANELRSAQSSIDIYKEEAAYYRSERDHYMRYATELTAQLNLIQSIITAIVEGAAHMAYRPSNPTPPPARDAKLANDIEEGMKKLAKRYGANGGDHEHIQDEV